MEQTKLCTATTSFERIFSRTILAGCFIRAILDPLISATTSRRLSDYCLFVAKSPAHHIFLSAYTSKYRYRTSRPASSSPPPLHPAENPTSVKHSQRLWPGSTGARLQIQHKHHCSTIEYPRFGTAYFLRKSHTGKVSHICVLLCDCQRPPTLQSDSSAAVGLHRQTGW